jgi:hypothetical protein
MKTFLHLTVFPADSDMQKLIQEKLNKATDWIRYSPSCWLIYTGQPATVWYQRLTEIEGIKEGSLLIYEVNFSNRAGWIARSVWDWIKKQREETG